MKDSPRREGCPASSCDDAAVFARLNRCPLFRGRLNQWVVRRTLRGNPSDAAILNDVGVAFSRWFSPLHAWGFEPLIAACRALARRAALELSGEVAATSDAVSPSPLMLGDSFASLRVDFIYFGAAEDMPWPVHDARGAWLPVDCVWALDLVGAPNGS